MVRTPDPKNDLKWLKTRETRLQNELSRVKKKIAALEGQKLGESIVDDCGCDGEGDIEQSAKKSKTKSTKKGK